MLSRKNIFIQPIIQREIICQAAEQAHAHVCMGVDQSRENEPAACIDHLSRFIHGLDMRGCVDGGDGISLNRDRAIFQDAPLSVHGDHGTVRHDQIHSLLGEGRHRMRWRPASSKARANKGDAWA